MEIRVNTAAVNRQAAVDRASSLTEPFFYSEALRSADRKISGIPDRHVVGTPPT